MAPRFLLIDNNLARVESMATDNAPKKIIGLDIGTNKVAAIVGEVREDGLFEIVSSTDGPLDGRAPEPHDPPARAVRDRERRDDRAGRELGRALEQRTRRDLPTGPAFCHSSAEPPASRFCA